MVPTVQGAVCQPADVPYPRWPAAELPLQGEHLPPQACSVVPGPPQGTIPMAALHLHLLSLHTASAALNRSKSHPACYSLHTALSLALSTCGLADFIPGVCADARAGDC